MPTNINNNKPIFKLGSVANIQRYRTIPSEANTYSIVLSDIEFDALGNVGYIDSATHQAVPWELLRDACAAGSEADCNKLLDAATVLINGGSSTATRPSIKAKSGSGIRLQLLNPSTIRYFRQQVIGNGTNNNLYRIGGEGGFLDFTRLEGGRSFGPWPPVTIPDIPPAAGKAVIEYGICPVDSATDRKPKMPDFLEKEHAPELDSKGPGCSTTNAGQHSIFIAAFILWILPKRRRAAGRLVK